MSKCISLDKEAYEILKSHKLDGKDSFSEVVKRNMSRAGDWESLFQKYGVRRKAKKKHAPSSRQ